MTYNSLRQAVVKENNLLYPFVFHWTSHKVRLLWCIHAPHHAPTHMNLSVIFMALFLQGPYATFVRTAICSILGVPMPLLILVMVIDACWGALIHFSEELWPSGAIGGVLGRVILSPLHHRIHHSSNSEYIDKNFCNTLPIWDAFFRTLQHEVPGVKPVYGLNREVKPNSFIDIYFGEIYLLVRYICAAPTLKQKILHIVVPPGWKPQLNRFLCESEAALWGGFGLCAILGALRASESGLYWGD